MRKILLIATSLLFCTLHSARAKPAYGTESFISTEKIRGAFPLAIAGQTAPLIISSGDWPGVLRAFKDLQSDIGKVTSFQPKLHTDKVPRSKEIVIAGTISKSKLIDELVKAKKIDVSDVANK